MNNMKKRCLLLFALLMSIVVCTHAQFSETYFNDTAQIAQGYASDRITYKNTIIISGRIADAQPGIVRIDTTGKQLWSVTGENAVSSAYPIYVYKMILGADGYIYALNVQYISISNVSYTELWKVDPETGVRVWMKTFSDAKMTVRMLDYDSTTMIISYPDNYNSTTYRTKFFMISKATGNVLSSHLMGEYPWAEYWYNMGVDKNKNIFYTKSDTLIKVHYSNPDSVLWKSRISQFSDMKGLYYSSAFSSLYLIGTYASGPNGASLVKVDPESGAVLFQVKLSSGNYNDIVIRDSFAYMSWSSSGPPYLNYNFRVLKYNLVTNNIPWDNSYGFGQAGAESISAMALDDSSNLYITGHCNNYSWGMLKLQGSNGSMLIQKAASNYGKVTEESAWMRVSVINNQPYLIGNIETNLVSPFIVGYMPSVMSLVATHSTTGNTLFIKPFGNYLLSSKTVSMQNQPGGNTVLVKQVGRRVDVEMYDNAKNLLWIKSLASKAVVRASHLAIDPVTGDLFISATSHPDTAHMPYMSQMVDSIYVFQLNASGNLLSSARFKVGLKDASIAELHADGSSAVVVYRKTTGGPLFLRKAVAGGFSAEVNTGITNIPATADQFRCGLNTPGDSILFFARKTGSVITLLRKGTLTLTDIKTLPSQLYTVHYLADVGAPRVALCAKNAAGNEVVALYDRATLDTVWTKTFLGNMTGVKCITDPSLSILYVLSYENTGKIIVRKLMMSTGAVIDTFTYTGGASNLREFPSDFSYDPIKDRLLISGLQKPTGSNSRPFVFMLGVRADFTKSWALSKQGASGQSIGTNALVWNNGTLMVGGNFNRGTQDGFIYEIDDSSFCPVTRSNTTITTCGFYVWNGTTYNQSGVYQQVIPNTDGCDSFMTLDLTVKPIPFSTQTVATCDSFIWNSRTYYTSGTYQVRFSHASGCDSIAQLSLTIRNNGSQHTVSGCDSILWRGAFLKTSGVYRDTFANTNGCDSVVILYLTINHRVYYSTNKTACNQYIFNGDTLITSGIYHDTIAYKGCDSIVTLNLTVNHSVNHNITDTACNRYVFNGQTYTTSGTYSHTFTGSNGCDSVIVLNLTIKRTTFYTLAQQSCSEFTFRQKTYTAGGTYYDTLTNAAGCDSIITLQLVINQPTQSTITTAVCKTYTLNGKTYTISGVYKDTLINTKGCDSILTLYLTIKPAIRSFQSVTACGSYVFNGRTYTSSGIYNDTLAGHEGCDSIIELNLMIRSPQQITLTRSGCRNYTQNGKTYTISGTYTDSLISSNGCDSIVILQLSITVPDTSVARSGDTLIAQTTQGTYQWVNCSGGYAVIQGATNRTFVPVASGSYAVILKQDACTDTSACLPVIKTGISEVIAGWSINVYPNPFSAVTTMSITSPLATETLFVKVINVYGELVQSYAVNHATEMMISRESLPAGMYFYTAESSGYVVGSGKLLVRD
jgi:hypothetical protein